MTPATGTPADVFAEFEKRHEHVNRFFWSTIASYHFAAVTTQSTSATTLLQELLSRTDERRYLFRRYLSKNRDVDPKARATVGDFQGDLKTNMISLISAAVIMEVANLELFLRDWSVAAARVELPKLRGVSARARRSQLTGLINDLESNERLSMTLKTLANHFPAAIQALRTTHRRTPTPLLSVPIPGATCLDAAQMWREIRNILVHHDRRCHASFLRDWSPVWNALEKDIAEDGLGAAGGGLFVGSRLPLTKRHVPYCLSTCYQTAFVFFLAAGGKTPAGKPSTSSSTGIQPPK